MRVLSIILSFTPILFFCQSAEAQNDDNLKRCPANYSPVCAGSVETYSNACVASVKGVAVVGVGSCKQFFTLQEIGTDRPGNDYMEFQEVDSAFCKMRCLNDGRCRAYTYDFERRRCWLKSVASPPVKKNSCISGISEAH